MDNYIDFNFVSDKKVSRENFENKIAEGKAFCKNAYKLTNNIFEEVRKSFDIEYKPFSADHRFYIGKYIEYDIIPSKIKLVCFLSNSNDFMEVRTEPYCG